MLARLITSPQRLISALSSSANCSGLLEPASTPRSARRFFDVGRCQGGGDCLVELGDNVFGRFGRYGQSVPRGGLHFCQSRFFGGGDVRQAGCALVAKHRQSTDGLGADLAHHRAQNLNCCINLPTTQGGDDGGCAVKGDDLRVDTGGGFEQFSGQVLRAADVDGAQIELAGVGFGEGQQLGQGFEGRIGTGHQGDVEKSQGRNRCKIFDGVVRQAFEEAGADGAAVGHQQQGRAVGLRFGHQVTGDDATGAGFVLNDHRLPQNLGHFLRHGACRQVGNTARAKGDDDFEGLVREARCACLRQDGRCQGRCQQRQKLGGGASFGCVDRVHQSISRV